MLFSDIRFMIESTKFNLEKLNLHSTFLKISNFPPSKEIYEVSRIFNIVDIAYYLLLLFLSCKTPNEKDWRLLHSK